MHRAWMAWSGLALLGMVACGSGEDPSFEGGGLPADIAEGEVPQLLAVTQCEQQMGCDCLDLAGPVGEDPEDYTLEQCVENRRLELEFWQQGAQFHGLTFDATCLARRYDMMTGLGCQGYEAVAAMQTEGSCDQACRVYHGDLLEGANCTLDEGVDHCGQGLYCDWDWDELTQEPRGTCRRRCAFEGQSCEQARGCATGSYCNENEVCTPLPKVGQACPTYECFGAICNPSTLTCEAITMPGEACSPGELSCLGGCVDGVCQEGPPRVCQWSFVESYQ